MGWREESESDESISCPESTTSVVWTIRVSEVSLLVAIHPSAPKSGLTPSLSENGTVQLSSLSQVSQTKLNQTKPAASESRVFFLKR